MESQSQTIEVFRERTIQDGTDRYRLLGLLGQGGMANVYLAYDKKENRQVAIKMLQKPMRTPELKKRLIQEVELMELCNRDPSIVMCLDVGIEVIGGTSQIFFVMEYFNGQDLTVMLDSLKEAQGDRPIKGSLVPSADFYRIVERVLHALMAVHKASVVHRDLKPHNILWHREDDGELTVRLADFGIAKKLEDATMLLGDENKPISRHNTMIGTPLYLSPEQASGDNLDARSDLFAVGLTMYEMVTGQPASSEYASLVQLCFELTQPFDPARYPSKLVEGINPKLERMILDLLERDPAQRITSAAAALTRLRAAEAYERGVSLPAPSNPPVTRPPRPRRVARPLVLGAAMLAAGVLVTLFASKAGLLFSEGRADASGSAAAMPARDDLSASRVSSVPPVSIVTPPVPSAPPFVPMTLADLSRRDRQDFLKAVSVIRLLPATRRCGPLEEATFLALIAKVDAFPDAYYWAAECARRSGKLDDERTWRQQYEKKSGRRAPP